MSKRKKMYVKIKYFKNYTLQFQRYCLDKVLNVNVTVAISKAKSRSHHDAAHLQPPTNVPTNYQLPTPYSFSEI